MSTIKFEDGYIFRNNRTITTTPDIALTELIANSWDAGAFKVDITIPVEYGDVISVLDDGCGMTDEEFTERWMTLNYNREKHQGKHVVFPGDVKNTSYKRIAYGRNGVGRHGMLCFSDMYTVETWNDGEGYKYLISITHGNEPFSVASKEPIMRSGHGTRISAYLNRNLPNIDLMKEILSARFIYDPQFVLKINGEMLSLSTSEGVIHRERVTTNDGVSLDINIVDSSKSARASKRHGVAFWVSGRLVGSPSWSYKKWQFLDARYKIAKRYTIIVQSDDIIDDVLPDWTGFFDTPKMDGVFDSVRKVVLDIVQSVMNEQITELKNDLIEERREKLQRLSIAEKREVSDLIDIITLKNPMIATEFLSVSVDALLQIQKSKRGIELLAQISNMSAEDIDNLSELLKSWDINDIISVIDEIDRRILVVEAIARVCDNDGTDELHTLHPMVLNSKWLFGAEFDSPMFTSNKTLNTVVKTLFNDGEYDLDAIANPRKRPDIVCLKTSTMRFVCTEKSDIRTGEILKPDQILIIELKRGGSEIGSSEVAQVEYYVRQIKKAGVLHEDASIHAFVVGTKIGDIDEHKETLSGIVDVVTYGHLVQTANKKLFGLRERLEEHYNSIGDESLVEIALKKPEQLKLPGI